MKSVLVETKIRINSLKKYLALLEMSSSLDTNIDKLKDRSMIQSLKEYVSLFNEFKDKRIYDYNLIIITTYGILENFIEEAIKVYLDYLCKLVPDYNMLPDKIRSSHVEYSANLIKYIRTMSKYSMVHDDEIIRNLNTCIVGKGNYQMNSIAYTYHSSNFRQQSINEIFQNIGIKNILDQTKAIEQFKKYHSDLLVLEISEIQGLPNNVIFDRLDQLAERRNWISHGCSTDDILSISRLKDELEFLETFIEAIYEVLDNSLAYYDFQYSNKMKIDNIINIFNNEILCCEISNYKLASGNNIFIYNREKDNVKLATVVSIQIDKVDVIETPIEEKLTIGMKLSKKIKDNYEFYVKL